MSGDNKIKNAIKAESDKRFEKKEVEFFSQKLFVVTLSSYELEAWRAYKNSKDEQVRRKAPAKMVQIALRNEDGSYVYKADEVDQIAALKPAIEIDKIEQAAVEINGFSVKGLEEILKNLLKTHGGSGSQEEQASTESASQDCSEAIQPENSESNT